MGGYFDCHKEKMDKVNDFWQNCVRQRRPVSKMAAMEKYT
jgi:hypothetical protein